MSIHKLIKGRNLGNVKNVYHAHCCFKSFFEFTLFDSQIVCNLFFSLDIHESGGSENRRIKYMVRGEDCEVSREGEREAPPPEELARYS